MKRRFRSLFLIGLKKDYELLYLKGTKYQYRREFQKLIDELFRIEWVCYLKESFKNNQSVIKYLGKYTHRIAISNYRIKKLEGRMVTFKFKDYKDGFQKTETIDVLRFIRRFLLHVVPYRFVRIRYYGLLAHRNKQSTIESCREYFDFMIQKSEDKNWMELFKELTGVDISLCPKCKTGRLVLCENFGRPPPLEKAV